MLRFALNHELSSCGGYPQRGGERPGWHVLVGDDLPQDVLKPVYGHCALQNEHWLL